MNIKESNVDIPVQKKRGRFVRSLEYELIAHLAIQQYTIDGKPDFKRLLSIPMQERMHAHIGEYGLKRMHRLVKLILQEFCYAVALPKSKKLTDTRIAVCACDLILAAHEDGLATEDLILFFEGAKKGSYGKFRGVLTHFDIMDKLEQYRQERFNALVTLKQEREAALKALGPLERSSPEPTLLKNLFDDGHIPMKKIS